ncbi:hypothetical protein JAAARDRAFT_29072 [Jaapia argillacea MUCL 33604]|uniref:Copper transporter n=1 Tax=Jaapia argillacea MUCL 33604 TaxID=933084 RepID=A0A067QKC3_9AGAM|nr:hypothetical protein JAAARDRAFT_29072 [Jaapia argillacea MUCL 33604]
MDGGWQDRLHLSFLGEHVLLGSLRLDSFWHFIVASLLTFSICLTERALTFALTKNWVPFASLRRSRFRSALWRTVLYWVVTFERLLYMLIAMTFHIGLLVVTVTTLALGQFIIEYYEIPQQSQAQSRESFRLKEPLLNSPTFASDPSNNPVSVTTRPRSKSKPDAIFIHPAQSNLARADAAAMEMGIAGDTDRVKGNQYSIEDDAWQTGKGKEVARALLHGSNATAGRRQQSAQHVRRESEQRLFQLGEDTSDDEQDS